MTDQAFGGQLIGYAVSKEGTATFKAFNPVTRDWLPAEFVEATEQEVNRAVALAAQAFNSYKHTTGAQRAAFLHAIADHIMALGDELLAVAGAETGLPLARLQGERGRTVGQLQLFARYVEEGSWVNARIDTAIAGLPRVPDVRQLQVPLGVAGVFGASNFPLAFSVAGGDTTAALAAGCPVVFKAHPAHPHTSWLTASAIRKAAQAAGMPEGVFSLLQGASHDTGMRIVTHPLVSVIGFTGSFRGGKALYDAAVRRDTPIPVYAEMGSVNPVFFLPRILQEKGEALAQQFLQSVTMGTGQFCTNPGVFLTLPSPQTDAFIGALRKQVAEAAGGPMLTPGILQAYRNGIDVLLKEQQLEILGTIIEEKDGEAPPYLLETSVQQAVNAPVVSREVFGPSSVHIRGGSMEELLQYAQQLEGQLTATIFGTEEDLAQAAPLVSILREKAGRLIVNGFPTGVAVNHAMVHGGPYPAVTPAGGTSVGTGAIYRFTRPVCFQDFPPSLLPDELKDENPLGIWRLLNGTFTKEQLLS